MGAKISDNNTLRNIGQKANEENPNSFFDSSAINLTNNIIISQSKSDPEVDYEKKKIFGRRCFCLCLSS